MAMNSANDAVNPDQQIRMPKTGEVVAERLRRQIARGELTIGQRLPPEDELTAVFGIARTTLREALRILESQGLLEIRRGRAGGPVVTMPKIDSLAEGLAVTLQLQGTTAGDLDIARQLIEPRLAGRLAQSHTTDDLVALQTAADRA
ncbi:MAG: GntR family transcriptional regulator, transcriptional repressor for pyruvate dehydrogenase complex, partial [Actinomycetota bacterium]|nr:GntR family transcriptional regulator, transcriptional repressor for pyruvate dehydrogenase complex [Actinomycetota bacterium]